MESKRDRVRPVNDPIPELGGVSVKRAHELALHDLRCHWAKLYLRRDVILGAVEKSLDELFYCDNPVTGVCEFIPSCDFREREREAFADLGHMMGADFHDRGVRPVELCMEDFRLAYSLWPFGLNGNECDEGDEFGGGE